MKFTVELDDFWMDEENENISKELNTFVVRQVKSEIWQQIKEKVQKEISLKVITVVENTIKVKIDTMVDLMINDGDLKVKEGNYSSSEEMTVKELILKRFGMNRVDYRKTIENLANNYTKELRSRYDLLFASQIITKMDGQGLLKDGVFKAIMEK